MMKRTALLLLVALAGQAMADQCNGDDWGNAGQFDYYVFQQSWEAQFCYNQNYPGCGDYNANSWMTSHLTIHGLWPQYNSEQSGHWWPQCCASQYGPNLNQTAINLLAAPLHRYWPDVQATNWPDYNTSDFWAHEWGKHGTCSGLDQYTFFSTVLQVYSQYTTPSAITNNVGGSVSRAELLKAYGASNCGTNEDCMVGLSCGSGGYLSDVNLCFDQNLNQISCPWQAISESPCGDNINIQAFGSSRKEDQIEIVPEVPASAPAAEHAAPTPVMIDAARIPAIRRFVTPRQVVA